MTPDVEVHPPIEDVLSYAVFPEVAVNFFKANGRM